jgi:hypothetical protein
MTLKAKMFVYFRLNLFMSSFVMQREAGNQLRSLCRELLNTSWDEYIVDGMI